MTESIRSSDSFRAMADAIREYDADGRKGERLLRSLEDPNNPNRPERNHNPLQVDPDEILVLENVRDNTRRRAFRVLSVHRGWDHRLFIGLGSADSPWMVQTSSLTVEDNGVNGIHHILSANYREGFPGIDESVRIVRIMLGTESR